MIFVPVPAHNELAVAATVLSVGLAVVETLTALLFGETQAVISFKPMT